MINQNTLIQLAINEAKKSDYKVKIGSVIFDKNKIISTGYNKAHSSKKIHPRFQKWEGSIHAEAMSILNARTNLKGCDIIVIRVNKRNQFRIAKPCKWCWLYLDYVGIDNVYYSIDRYPYIIKEKVR